MILKIKIKKKEDTNEEMNKNMDVIENFRVENGLDEIEYPNERIFKALKENDFDFDENDENIILKAFQHFDVDNSGKINVEEIKHVLTFLGDIMTEEEVNKFFKSVDIDKNGYLDYREFIHFWMNNA